MNTLAQLKAIGLSSYEARAYLFLMRNPDSVAEEIAEKSGVPLAKVYSVLNSLSKRGLIKNTLQRPKRYSAFPPEEALNTIAQQNIIKAKEQADSIIKLAKQLQKEHASGKEGRIWQVLSPEAVWREVRKQFLLARTTTKVVANTANWQIVLNNPSVIPTEHLEKRRIRSLNIMPRSLLDKMLKHPETIPDNLLVRHSSQPVRIRSLPEKDITINMAIVDDVSAGIGILDPETGKAVVGLILKGEKEAEPYVKMYDQLWEKADKREQEVRMILQSELARRKKGEP